MLHRAALVLMVLAGACLWSVQADDKANPKADPNAAQLTETAVRQQTLARQFREFEQALLRLAQRMGKSSKPEERERAAVLMEAIKKAGEEGVNTKFDKLISLLQASKAVKLQDLTEAMTQSQMLVEDIRAILALLMNDNRDEKLKEERDRLQRLIAMLEQAIRDQKIVRAQNETGRMDKDRLGKAQEKVTGQTGDIARLMGDGKDAKAGDNKGDGKGDGEAKEGGQGQGKDDTGEQKAGMKDGNGEGEPSDNGGKGKGQEGDGEGKGKGQGEGQGEGDGKGKGQDQKPGQGQGEGQKPGQGQGDKPGQGQGQGEKPGQGQGQGEKPGQGQGEGQGQGQGEGKGKGDGKGDGKGKGQGQGQSQGKGQGQGQGQGQGDGKGEGQQGGQQNQQQQGQEQTPGRKTVQDAIDQQRQAIENIQKQKKEDTSINQTEAIKKLEEARAELERLLRQLREEELLRILEKLQARCERMLAMQLEVYDGTVRLHKTILEHSDKKPTRNEESKALQLSDREQEIVREANAAIKLLEAEGTAVAFPEVFTQVRDDMINVARRLGKADVADVTQTIEQDIIATLKEMIEALKKAQQDAQQRQQQPPPPGQQPPNQNQNLIDMIAELKMIKAMQLRVNTRTTTYGKMYTGEQTADPDIQKELANLAQRQLKIFEVTNNIAKGKNR